MMDPTMTVSPTTIGGLLSAMFLAFTLRPRLRSKFTRPLWRKFGSSLPVLASMDTGYRPPVSRRMCSSFPPLNGLELVLFPEVESEDENVVGTRSREG